MMYPRRCARPPPAITAPMRKTPWIPTRAVTYGDRQADHHPWNRRVAADLGAARRAADNGCAAARAAPVRVRRVAYGLRALFQTPSVCRHVARAALRAVQQSGVPVDWSGWCRGYR